MILRKPERQAEPLTDAAQVSAPLARAFELWQGQAGAEPLPAWRVDRLLDFDVELVPWAMMLAFEPAFAAFRIRFCGTRWAPFFGRDLTHETLPADAGPSLAMPAHWEAAAVRDGGRPHVFRVDFPDAVGRRVQFHKIALPYRAPAGAARADVVLALYDPRQFGRQVYEASGIAPPLRLPRGSRRTADATTD